MHCDKVFGIVDCFVNSVFSNCANLIGDAIVSGLDEAVCCGS